MFNTSEQRQLWQEMRTCSLTNHFLLIFFFFFCLSTLFLFLTILWQKARASAPLDALHLGICSFQHNEGVLGLTHGWIFFFFCEIVSWNCLDSVCESLNGWFQSYFFLDDMTSMRITVTDWFCCTEVSFHRGQMKGANCPHVLLTNIVRKNWRETMLVFSQTLLSTSSQSFLA